jgi:hypothetical protein
MSKLKVGLILGIVIVLTLAVVASGCKTSQEAVECQCSIQRSRSCSK